MAESIDTGGGADGSVGISTIRLLATNIDVNTVVFEPGLGAITDIFGNPTVLDLGLSVIEVLYGQDISDFGTVVGGVGVGGPTLLASGSTTGVPAFASDPSNPSLTSEGLFLPNLIPGDGAAVDPDNNILTFIGVPEPTSAAVAMIALVSSLGFVRSRGR